MALNVKEYNKIKLNAISYWYAYEALVDHNAKQFEIHYKEKIPLSDTKLCDHVENVLLSFCLELFLKTALCFFEIESTLRGNKKHSFYYLFKELPENIQNDIYVEWNSKIGPHTLETLLYILESQQNSFQDWRYVHEDRPRVTEEPSSQNGLMFSVSHIQYLIGSIHIILDRAEKFY